MNFSGNNNESQQRHVAYASSSGQNFRQAQKSSVNELIKDKNHHANRPKFSTLRGKSWSAFTECYGCESSKNAEFTLR